MRTRVKSKMRCGFVTWLLVFGLAVIAYGEDDNVESETQNSSNSINFQFLDKNKRGATKITSTDNPSFNHPIASNIAATSSAGGSKPTNVNSNSSPFRYVYNEQYYQSNPYLTYIHIPQGAQYSFQSNPVAHFLQTPTQIQYVATPAIVRNPQIKYHSSPIASPTGSEAAASSASASQFVAHSRQPVVSPVVQVSGPAAQSKETQIPVYSGYQTGQPVFYAHQPVFTYFPQAQSPNYVYQQPNANYLFKQQQQHIASVYGADRFGLYTPAQNSQLTYLVPLVLTQSELDSRITPTTTATANAATVKASDKTLSNTQQSSSSNSFPFGTKA